MTATDSVVRPGDAILDPVVLSAVALMAVNDHVLKGVGPGWLTGKLSDVAGLVLLPMLLQAWVEVCQAVVGRFHGRSDAVLRIAVTVSVVGFTAVNVWAVAERAWQVTWGALQLPARSVAAGGLVSVVPVAHTADVTDLLTLPAVAIPLVAGSTTWRRRAAVGGDSRGSPRRATAPAASD